MSDCMEAKAVLPSLKGDLHFEYSNGGWKLTCESWDGEHRFEVLRDNNRWRIPRGYLTSSHRIASHVFTYQPNPTQQEMHWMGGYIEDLGCLLDTASEAIRSGVKAELDRRTSPPKEFFPPQQDYQPYQSDTFVYLMSHTNGLTKIGMSKNPQAREKTLQAEDPRLQMLFCWKASFVVERRLHEIFSTVRVRGEWFNLKPHHIDWIKYLLASK